MARPDFTNKDGGAPLYKIVRAHARIIYRDATLKRGNNFLPRICKSTSSLVGIITAYGCYYCCTYCCKIPFGDLNDVDLSLLLVLIFLMMLIFDVDFKFHYDVDFVDGGVDFNFIMMLILDVDFYDDHVFLMVMIF